jgi:predicted MFS family arabinose efflux permease
MGGGAVTIASTLFCGFGVRYFSHRWFFVVATTVPTIIGAALMAWAPHKDKGGLLAGIYLVNTFIGSTPIIYQWLTANFAGHTKRAFSSAFLNGAFAVGNIIGPQTFQARDAPEYHPARVSMVATQTAALGVTVALFFYYVLVNKRRDAQSAADGDSISDAKAYAGLTDKRNEGFRYTY